MNKVHQNRPEEYTTLEKKQAVNNSSPKVKCHPSIETVYLAKIGLKIKKIDKIKLNLH